MNAALENKIVELFKYRKLPSLLKLAGTSKKKEKVFYDNLIKLQAAIYDLDLYLESNWNLDEQELKEKWKPIYASLKALKVSKAKQVSYVRQIEKYQKHEMNIRLGKYPTKYTMDYFYYYKSCDVKLIRQLMYDKFPVLKKEYKLSDWRLFDLVTEVVDDLTDIVEDTEVYNGNRFVIATIVEGKKKTFATFDRFLNEIDTKLEAEKWKNKNLKKLKKWTLKVIAEADDIMDDLAADFPKKLIKKSKIAKKLK